MQPEPKHFWQKIDGAMTPRGGAEFKREFEKNFSQCDWKPHPLYSVFTQYDFEYYLRREEEFQRKYRCFYAVSKTIAPKSIIEMGMSAGSSADAYLSAAPEATFIGMDTFGVYARGDNVVWDPYQIAGDLFRSRGFSNWELVRINLRSLQELPGLADLVVVDAAHDFENEYADLQLALTAKPKFIFVDDSDDENDARPAIEKFLVEDLKGRVAYTVGVPYTGGGLVIKLAK